MPPPRTLDLTEALLKQVAQKLEAHAKEQAAYDIKQSSEFDDPPHTYNKKRKVKENDQQERLHKKQKVKTTSATDYPKQSSEFDDPPYNDYTKLIGPHINIKQLHEISQTPDLPIGLRYYCEYLIRMLQTPQAPEPPSGMSVIGNSGDDTKSNDSVIEVLE